MSHLGICRSQLFRGSGYFGHRISASTISRVLFSTSPTLFAKPQIKANINRATELDQIGLPMRFYIPPSYKNYPNVLSSPIVVFKLIARRLYNFGRNTVQIAFARWNGGMTPKFLLWKNEAVDVFIKVNKAFAKKKIQSISNDLSVWTREPLLMRQDTLPKKYDFDWKLLKLLSPPKLCVLIPYSNPSDPLDKLLVIYKFNTLQRLTKMSKETKEVISSSDDSIENYLGFLVDLNTDKLKLIGSTFESGPNEKVDIARPKHMGSVMKVQGDIFRINDELLKEYL